MNKIPVRNKSEIMQQSIPPVPIQSGYPGAFVQVLCPGGGVFVHPVATPQEFDTRGSKTAKSPGRQVACFIPLQWRLSWEKIWISCRSGLACPRRTRKPLKIFRGEFSNFRKFFSAL